MPAGDATTPPGTLLPILICHVCDPPRPMIIRTVKTSMLRRSQKIMFACAKCDSLVELGSGGNSDGSSTGKRQGP